MSVQLQSGALLPLFHSRGPACHDFGRTGGRAEELAIMTKVYCSETAVDMIYDCMRVVGVASYQGPRHAGTDHARRHGVPLHDGAIRACGAGSCTTSSASLDTIPSVPAARGEALPENGQG